MSALPQQAFAAALVGLDRMTVARLRVLLAHATPEEAFAMASGEGQPHGLAQQLFDVGGLAVAWRQSARELTPERAWERCCELGIDVLIRGGDGFPEVLVHDPAPAPVLFIKGSFAKILGRRVGLVGTRNATASGRETAATLGRDLSAEGVHIVSGLARGIDGAAHRGAVAGGAPPIAVVASGLDVVYPAEHRRLWDEVADRGALISEAAPGGQPEAYRFPLRNRIIAGLSEVLVVVESRERGGSLITVDEARKRDVLVMAVPGSVRNRAAQGTNDLVRDGCPIVTGTGDVMMALGLDHSRTGAVSYDGRPRPSGIDRELWDLCIEARTLDQFVLLTGHSLVDCAMAAGRLELTGWLQQLSGWFERSDFGLPH